MKEWKIPVTWQVCGTVTIQADRLDEALFIARDDAGVLPLPDNGDYVDGSWEVSDTNVEEVRTLYNNNQQDKDVTYHISVFNEEMADKINELNDDDFYDVMMCLAQKFGNGTSYLDVNGFCEKLKGALNEIQFNLINANDGVENFLDSTKCFGFSKGE